MYQRTVIECIIDNDAKIIVHLTLEPYCRGMGTAQCLDVRIAFGYTNTIDLFVPYCDYFIFIFQLYHITCNESHDTFSSSLAITRGSFCGRVIRSCLLTFMRPKTTSIA